MFQSTDTVLMVKPKIFNQNPSINDNVHMGKLESIDSSLLETEFDYVVDLLRMTGVTCDVIQSENKSTFDALFPNNVFSFHGDTVVKYKMYNYLRQQERGLEIYPDLNVIDMDSYLEPDEYLEGTGSLVLDRINKIAYASLSNRTSSDAVLLWCKKMNYTPVIFNSRYKSGEPVYHTNILLSIGTKFAVVCLDVIDNKDVSRVVKSIENSGKSIIIISEEQLHSYCGNILELKGDLDYVLMSETALQNFDYKSRSKLESLGLGIVALNIPYIEKVYGGGIRCMIAEKF